MKQSNERLSKDKTNRKSDLNTSGNIAKVTDQNMKDQSGIGSDILRSRSTSIKAQRQRILQALKLGPKTSYDLRCLGCYQAPARIKELRDKFGYVITTERVTLYDRDGYMHLHSARYTLVSGPKGV